MVEEYRKKGGEKGVEIQACLRKKKNKVSLGIPGFGITKKTTTSEKDGWRLTALTSTKVNSSTFLHSAF